MKKVSKKAKVITRFAPSPTGLFHIGSARTALFNYLFAKNKGGQFILRIEDTDKERSKLEFEKDIIDSLDWLGVKCDIGPIRQSERIQIYKKYLEKLLKDNKAYYCFCTQEELDAVRQDQSSRGVSPKYNGKCSNLSKEEIKNNLKDGKKSVIRFRTPIRKVKFKDLIRAEIEFDGSLIGDFVIAKDLETPLYNFTVVVDDSEMAVSHIIRGEDLLPNTPKQIFIEDALGFPQPQFAHLSLILGPDRSKLSKRHGATSVSEYRQKGYLPEVIVNFISFLGWNPGTDKEVYSLKELEQDFSLENISKGGAIFNVKRLDYLNGLYIRQKSLKELTELCIPFLVKRNLIKPDISRGELDEISKMISLYHERLKYISEIPDLIDFFLKDKLEYLKEMLVWKDATNRETKHIIDKLINILSGIEVGEWKKGNLESILLRQAEEVSLEIKNKKDRGYMLWPFRVALTGKEFSAGPFEIAEILGKERVLDRLNQAKELL